MQVMSVLWDLRSATAAQVHHALRDLWEPEMAYTTVSSHLRSLCAKGWVEAEKGARAHQFVPIVSQNHARDRAVFEIIDVLFNGKLEDLLRHVLYDRKLKRPAIVRLRRILEARLEPPRTRIPPSGAARCAADSP